MRWARLVGTRKEEFSLPEKDVASDELVDDLALGGDALEDDVVSAAELDHHVSGLPVHVPRLKEPQ